MKDVDSRTFQKLSDDYFKDGNAIWTTNIDNRGNFQWVTLPDADMATFTVIDTERGIAKDKYFHYSNGKAYTPRPPQQAAKP